MHRFLVVVIFSGLALAQEASLPIPTSVTDGTESTAGADRTLDALPNLPPLPRGKSTVIGGTIRNVDRVRDQLTVSVFGGRDMKILFDERTAVYRDGKRISLRDLRNGYRGSFETSLDGAAVFTRSIRILTRAVEGECQGQVLGFDAARGELSVRDTLSSEALNFILPRGTTISRQGQEAFSSAALSPGSLVRINFRPDNGRAVVSSITILATPGDSFVFTGRVTFLDLSTGRLAIVDPRDQNRYEVSVDPRSASLENLHLGNDVTIRARFDGTQYTANTIQLGSAPVPPGP
jgi:hypothetical protein